MLKVKETLAKIVPLLDYTKTDEVWVAPADQSVTSGTTPKQFGSFTLSAPGYYLICIAGIFVGTTVSGKKALRVSTTSTGTSVTPAATVFLNAANGGYTSAHFTFIYKCTDASRVLYVNGFQNSGGTDTLTLRMQALRLR